MFELTFSDGSVDYTDIGESTRDIELLIKKHDKSFRLVDLSGELRDCYCFPILNGTWIYLYRHTPGHRQNYKVSFHLMHVKGTNTISATRSEVVSLFRETFREILTPAFVEHVW